MEFFILEHPSGSKHFIWKTIRKKIQKIKDITDKLETIYDRQIEYMLLRSSLHLPKSIYVLRTLDHTPYMLEWMRFDQITHKTLAQILTTSNGSDME